MECNKWEEYGLLFVSGELEDRERQSFEQHLQECSFCTQERKTYQVEKERFYTEEILGDTPSAACDAEIMRVCSDGRRKVAGVGVMSLFVRKSVVSIMLFALGFVGVGYITLKTGAGNRNTGTPTVARETSVASEPVAKADNLTGTAATDSSSDSSSDKGVNFSKTRGNLDLNGVYPVDLQNK